MQTIEFHTKVTSKYFLAPDFTTIALSDEASIADALDIVLRAKKKSVLPGEKQSLISEIERLAKGKTVGSLREMESDLWPKFELPLICRVYLRHLIMQSCSLTHSQLLECDFNSGIEYGWPMDKVQQILALGFTRNEALEAILVTDNKQVELAAQYLLTDLDARKLEYERCKRQRNISVPPNRHWTVVQRMKEEKKRQTQWVSKSENILNLEIEQLKNTLADVREKRLVLEKKRDIMAKTSRLTLYGEYIRGLLAEPLINTAETQHMDRYRRQRKLTADDHLQVLKNLGYTEATFDALKTYEDTTNDEDECVVCYEPPKDHMILPCNHVCLCQECAEQNFPAPHEKQTCPLCSKEVETVQQIFYF